MKFVVYVLLNCLLSASLCNGLSIGKRYPKPRNTNARHRSNTRTTALHLARGYATPYFSNDDSNMERESSLDRPTQTLLQLPQTPSIPSKPTILVLGATGRIGRLIVSALMECDADITVLAHVRNYEKAMHVLYDYHDNTDDGLKNYKTYSQRRNYALVNRGSKSSGPQLKIIEGDLVSEKDVLKAQLKVQRRTLFWKKLLFFKKTQHLIFQDDDMIEIEYPASFSSSQPSNATTLTTTTAPRETFQATLAEETLHDAITQSTIIISALGTVRYTNILTDFILKPWRIFQKDVSSWCADKKHPYYVCFQTTQKILKMAEMEQLRRNEILSSLQKEDDAEKSNVPLRPGQASPQHLLQDKIKIIRITDLAVTNKPYGFDTIVTNLVRSLIFRYQQMSENILRMSRIVDTVVLRPGDLIQEERNTTTTSLQVSSTGEVPRPAKVSRSDVAAVAVAAALTKLDLQNADTTSSNPKKQKTKADNNNTPNGHINNNNQEVLDAILQQQQQQQREAHHLTLGMRWVSETLQPEPQGFQKDGHKDANAAMKAVLIKESKKYKRKRRMEWKKLNNYRRLQELKLQQQSEEEGQEGILTSFTSLLSDVILTSQTSTLLTKKKRRSWLKQRKLRKVKPYGFFVALPVYTMLIWMVTSIVNVCFITSPQRHITGRKMWKFGIRQLSMLMVLLKQILVRGSKGVGVGSIGRSSGSILAL